jgi:hypothetical protein
MKTIRPICLLIIAIFTLSLCSEVTAQSKPEILNDKDATAVIPSSFYFAGQSAPTQMRNASVARLAKDRLVIAGLVDTSGYSTEISGKYEGFFITDSPIKIGDKTLNTGAYGFGFSADGKLNIFDISSKQILSVSTKSDAEIKRPRPLQMVADVAGVRLYKGKNYAVISAR